MICDLQTELDNSAFQKIGLTLNFVSSNSQYFRVWIQQLFTKYLYRVRGRVTTQVRNKKLVIIYRIFHTGIRVLNVQK